MILLNVTPIIAHFVLNKILHACSSYSFLNGIINKTDTKIHISIELL